MRIRSGKYSNEEDAVIKSNINSYRRRKDMSEVEVVEAIISKDKEVRKQHHIFWTDLARALHDRPLMSIYHHVTRLLAPTARQGSWSKEEDAKLKAAVDQHGQKWEDIALEVGRWSGDCRDRWRNYISAGDSKAVGKWTQAEEDKLRECVRRVKEANEAYGNVDAGDTEIFWTSVAKAFGGTRTRHQCRIKWTDNMANKILTKDGDKVRWSRRDAFIFITKYVRLQRLWVHCVLTTFPSQTGVIRPEEGGRCRMGLVARSRLELVVWPYSPKTLGYPPNPS
jgi:Myb-like DNA-binding protein REB1